MNTAELIQLGMLICVIAGAVWYLLRLQSKADRYEDRNKELEKENAYLRQRNDAMQDAIMKLK